MAVSIRVNSYGYKMVNGKGVPKGEKIEWQVEGEKALLAAAIEGEWKSSFKK